MMNLSEFELDTVCCYLAHLALPHLTLGDTAIKLRSWSFTPLFEKEGLGEIFLINPPQSPFFKAMFALAVETVLFPTK